MSTINFIVAKDTGEHVFNKNVFRYMNSGYSSGTTGTIIVTFAAEGDLIDEDEITLTVDKAFLGDIIKDIANKINSNGHSEIKHSQSSGLYKYVTAMTYTAG